MNDIKSTLGKYFNIDNFKSQTSMPQFVVKFASE